MYVFISYAHDDRAIVTPLVTLMRCAGARVFLDVASIPLGENWKQAIERAIRACDRMIVMWSAAAARSKWVAREIDEAQAQTKSIVPVMIDEARITSYNVCYTKLLRAMPTPNTVSGRPRCSNSRRMRHTPTREPYS